MQGFNGSAHAESSTVHLLTASLVSCDNSWGWPWLTANYADLLLREL